MEKFTVPAVQPLAKETLVTVPVEAWKDLCTTINNIVNAVNTQAEAISSIETKHSKLKEVTEQNQLNLSKLAKIMEDIYEMLE